MNPTANRSTGQDAAAVIKKELQQLLPGIKIFLDVHALQQRAACSIQTVQRFALAPHR